MVHVGAVDAPVSVGDVTQIAAEFKQAIGTGKDAPKTNGVDVLGWDFAFELNEVAKQQAAAANIQMRFMRIPRDVMDKRAVEQGDIHFFELAALSVDVEDEGARRDAEADRLHHPAGRRAGGRAQGGQALVAVDRLLGGGLGQQGRHVPQRVADLPHPQETRRCSLTTDAHLRRAGRLHASWSRSSTSSATTRPRRVKVEGAVAMAAQAQDSTPDQLDLLEATRHDRPVRAGHPREGRRRGATAATRASRDTTRMLLNYWFHTDHRLPDGRTFALSLLPARGDRDADLPLRGRQGPAAQEPARDLRHAQRPAACSSTTTSPATASRWRPAAARPR